MPEKPPATKIDKVLKTDAEWRQLLSPDAFRVVRQKGTERAFSGAYWDHHGKGIYACAACDLPLYSSETKFDSGTGWPSFWQAVAPEHLGREDDSSWFAERTELVCARCGGHLGHVFDDGPKPTGERHCINSVSLKFLPADQNKPEKKN